MTKNPILAGFLSLIVPGLGQAYNKQFIKGILFFLFPLVFYSSVFLTNIVHNVIPLELSALICLIMRIYSAMDAKRSVENNTAEDFSFSKFKFEYGLLNKYTILTALFIILIVFGSITQHHDDVYIDPTNSGTCDANSSDITITYTQPQDTGFYIQGPSTPSTDLYETRISGSGTITIDLSKIKWNNNVQENFSSILSENIDNDTFDLDIAGLGELDYGGQYQAHEGSNDGGSSSNNQVSRYSLDTHPRIDSYSIDGDILTMQITIPPGYGYVKHQNIDIENKTASISISINYNGTDYRVEVGGININYVGG